MMLKWDFFAPSDAAGKMGYPKKTGVILSDRHLALG
jgi:hypothetical protein